MLEPPGSRERSRDRSTWTARTEMTRIRASDSSSPLRATTEGARIRLPSVNPRCPPAYAGVRPTKVRVRNISLPPNHKNVFRTEHTDVFQMEHGLNHRGCFGVGPWRARGNARRRGELATRD